MKYLCLVDTAPDYTGESIRDDNLNVLEVYPSGIIFSSGSEELQVPGISPHNYAELEVCIESLQAQAKAKSYSLAFQNVLQMWWSVLTN